MSRGATAVFLVQRLGPYHHARLRAWTEVRTGQISVIEFRPGDAVYAWTSVSEDGGYERFQTSSGAELSRRLEAIQPQIIVCVGYADPEIAHAMTWAFSRHVPLVTCSDSTFADESRTWGKEMFKRQVVAGFDAALVAGSRALDYLAGLGLDGQRQFRPWDVVDNPHFEKGADSSRADEKIQRSKLNLPLGYFLCVARFVPKKNLSFLIKAYARYVLRTGDAAWSLVLSGSGPLEAELRQYVAAMGLIERVHFPGFLQYSVLPAVYGLAGALVLPSASDQWGLVVNEAMATGLPVLVSSRCGCVPDLVREGENGFTFASDDLAALTEILARVAEMDPVARTAMGRRSREIVAAFSPVAFAEGVEAAVSCALARRRTRVPWLTRIVVHLLARRAIPQS